MRDSATLNLTVLAHQALSLAEMRDLGYRAVDLHCRIGALWSSRHGWVVRVSSWEKGVNGPIHNHLLRSKGHLADVMGFALDQYAKQYAYTAEEILTIASQSGLAMTRA